MDIKRDYYFGIVEGFLREEAIALHHQRYEEVGFFKKHDSDPYVNFSTYFVAQTIDVREVVGVTRLIKMDLDDLPTIKHFNIYEIEKLKLLQLNNNMYAEVSAFTKLPNHDVGLGLIKTVLTYSLNNGLTHWICCIDERVYNYMHRMFKFPFDIIGEPNVYLGSKTIPCSLNLSGCLSSLREKRRPLYDYFLQSVDSVMEVVK